MTSDAEKAINAHLVAAWNGWIKLDDKHPDDVNEFRLHLHALQNMLAWRTARRADPETWGMGDKIVKEVAGGYGALGPGAAEIVKEVAEFSRQRAARKATTEGGNDPVPEPLPVVDKPWRYFVMFLYDHGGGIPKEHKNDVIEREQPIACLDDVRAIEAVLVGRTKGKWICPPVVTLLNWKELP